MRNPGGSAQPPAREEKVAFIGLGNMGAGIARNIMRSGFNLTVYNRTEAKMKPFIDAGATPARSPKEAAAGADIVITSLMGDDSVLSVLEGETGLLAGMKPGAIHVGTSTVSPACAMRLAKMHAQHGSHYLSAPVLGRPDVANAGQLVTFVAGEAEAIERCGPLFGAYTRMVRKIPGEQRLANVTKLCANYAAASVIELMGQIYTFADKCGVDLGMLEDLFQATWAHPGLKEYATQIRIRSFDSSDGFAMSGGLKDVELMLRASENEGVALEFAQIIKRKMLEAINGGMSDLDWSGTYEITRRDAGLS
jgi:3-hydroxyisobutyrate dehydrogenase-like beta-hydroxyacid dehydrogenase